ncbi:MAG: DUF1592 domain-containing protein [Verrucomicrobiota bacterium]
MAPSLAAADQAEKGTVLRRLNRVEFHNIVNDTFGTHTDLKAMLPEDGQSHGFDNVGSALGISMVQMQRYLEGINLVLDDAIQSVARRPEMSHVTRDYVSSREGKQHIPKAWGKNNDGAVVFYHRPSYPSGMLRETAPKVNGFYKIRITGYAHQSDKPVTFSVGGTSFKSGSSKPIYGFYSFEPGAPQVLEFTQFIQSDYMIAIEPDGLKDEGNYIRENKSTAGYSGPGLAINKVEVIGPITEEFPTRGHRLIFDGINRQVTMESRHGTEFGIASINPRSDAGHALMRVLEKAHRRPVTPEDVTPYLELFDEQTEKGADFESALRAVVAAIYLSPGFLYVSENPGKLDDFALATRLALALTRTGPDQQLLTAASEGKLTGAEGEVWNQAQRLMRKSHFDRFITDFTDAWLNLREIDFTAPDRKLFPEFDQYLQYSMLEETREFVRLLIRENLPAVNVVKSDFALLNERLAKHYGIDGVYGPQVRKVALPADSVRGGLLSQGSILKVSANGTNTSPVVRGVWVMERIMGQTPAPPPPGIPGVEPDIRGAETLRELLDKHRDSASCQACHQAIDPPGFALESFNPIGGWRENFRSLGVGEKVSLEVNGRRVGYRIGAPVDGSGVTADGQEFADYREFRDILASDQHQLAKALTKKLLVFFTGREMGFSDRPEINEIVKKAGQSGYGTRDLIRLVVESDIFSNK